MFSLRVHAGTFNHALQSRICSAPVNCILLAAPLLPNTHSLLNCLFVPYLAYIFLSFLTFTAEYETEGQVVVSRVRRGAKRKGEKERAKEVNKKK
jgi:hypothetical protein